MTRTERFTSLAEVRQEKQRLHAIREEHGARLERHWEALRDHDVRGALLSDAAGDMLRSWKPTRMLSSLFGGGSMGSSFGAALGSKGGLGKRLAMFALSMALPNLLKRVEGISLEDVAHHVRTAMERFAEYRKSRKEAHATEEHDA